VTMSKKDLHTGLQICCPGIKLSECQITSFRIDQQCSVVLRENPQAEERKQSMLQGNNSGTTKRESTVGCGSNVSSLRQAA
jgi:hypothetical protein